MKILAIPSTVDEAHEFIDAARESRGKVLVLREWFAKFFEGATTQSGGYPAVLRDLMQRGTKSEYTIFGMADSYLAAVPTRHG